MTGSLFSLISGLFKAHPYRHGASDMIALYSLFSAPTESHTGQLSAFAVKPPDSPAEAGRLLHGSDGRLRKIVGYDIIRAPGRKRHAEQLHLMTFRKTSQMNSFSVNLLIARP